MVLFIQCNDLKCRAEACLCNKMPIPTELRNLEDVCYGIYTPHLLNL